MPVQSFGPLCRIECSAEVKATCVNRELAEYPDMLCQSGPFALFVSTLGELMGRLRLLEPSGCERPTCEAAVVKVTEMVCNPSEHNLCSRMTNFFKHTS